MFSLASRTSAQNAGSMTTSRLAIRVARIPGQRDDSYAGEARQYRSHEVRPRFIDAERSRLAIGVATLEAHGGQRVLAILDRDVMQPRLPGFVSGAENRVQRDQARSVTGCEVADELTHPSRELGVQSSLSGRSYG